MRVGCSWTRHSFTAARLPLLCLKTNISWLLVSYIIPNSYSVVPTVDHSKRLTKIAPGLSPCWNHWSGVTKHKKLILCIWQDKQYFASATMVKKSLSYWKKPQVVEGFAFLPPGSQSCCVDNWLQARLLHFENPHQPCTELTNPPIVTKTHCPKHSRTGSNRETCDNETPSNRSTDKPGFTFCQQRQQIELQNGKII